MSVPFFFFSMPVAQSPRVCTNDGVWAGGRGEKSGRMLLLLLFVFFSFFHVLFSSHDK